MARAPILEPRPAPRLLVTCNQPFSALDGLTHDRLVVEQFGERMTVVTRLATALPAHQAPHPPIGEAC